MKASIFNTKYMQFLLIILLFTACNNKNSRYDASGVFETTEIVVSAKANGEILYFDLMEGQEVKLGQSLGLIDTTQLYWRKVQLQSSLKAMDSRQVNVAVQVAVLQEQLTAAHREKERFTQLIKENAANQKQLDDINAQIATLEKQIAAQTETLKNSNNSLINEQQSLLAQMAQIEDQLKNAVIKSPATATVLGKYAEAGELAVQGKALFKLADMENMFLRAYITASQLIELKIGQAVKVFSDMGKSDHREYEGTVSWISDKAEFTPKTIQTRDERANLVYMVKIAIRNDGYIKKGMYGEVLFN
ncbi:MAG: HlyD family efflux transporter periplasmic adaptor subunit [Bacteroidales bacterium]|jgi:HlyD family secretion protein|nr:HlyD family efflux transporter periplasmic adaptor subunit [Bacteroidales bacterium]MDD3701081.1 HlyD family efflux transporter periplasmic adaptor subunit [Bacteroidales bacterium]